MNRTINRIFNVVTFFLFVVCSSQPLLADSDMDQAELKRAIESYYNNEGEWAGVFRMDSIEKIRLEKLDAERSIAHVRYRYVPIPNNSQGRMDTGNDQRIFTVVVQEGRIKVMLMGDYMSASFQEQHTKRSAVDDSHAPQSKKSPKLRGRYDE